MANAESIRDALTEHWDDMLEAKLLLGAFTVLHEGIPASPEPLIDDHSWVFPLRRVIDRLYDSGQKLEGLITQKALPLLEDMDRLSKAK